MRDEPLKRLSLKNELKECKRAAYIQVTVLRIITRVQHQFVTWGKTKTALVLCYRRLLVACRSNVQLVGVNGQRLRGTGVPVLFANNGCIEHF